MHGGTHSCKIYKPLPQQGLINRLSGIKSSNPFDTDSICDYASQAMLKEHGQPRPCSFKFVRLYVNSWDRGKRKNVVAYIYYRSQVSLLFFLFCCNRQISLRIKRPPSQRISNEMAVNIFIMV